MRSKKLYMVFLLFAAMMIFAVQSVYAVNYVPATTANAALTAPGSTAVMIDVRSVDEHNSLCAPWSDTCPGAIDTSGPAGTPQWTVDGVTRLPIIMPYWQDSTAAVPGPPADAAEVTTIIEKLLATGVINFDTAIYFFCRSGYRSYYMIDWMEPLTFYNAKTDVTAVFTNLINIDVDGAPTGADGSMVDWNNNSLPLYPGTTVPPQVFSSDPPDGFTEYTDTGDVDFTISILEPNPGAGGYFTYPTVDRVSLYIDTVETEFSITDTTGLLLTEYPFTTNLADGVYIWTSSAQNSAGTIWNHNALDSGLDVRDLTVAPIPPCIDNDGDGYGNPGNSSCLNGSATDCDDTDADIYPGATEVCDGADNDCDGTIDEGFDVDGDGYTSCGGDCDDTDPAINPGVTEGPPGDPTCSDTLDNDCDSAIDAADTGCIPEVVSPQDAYDNAAAGIGIIIDVRTVEEHNGCNQAWRNPDNPGDPSECHPDQTELENRGSPQWIDTATGVMRQAPNVPFWIGSGASDTLPEDEAQFMTSFAALQAAGVIDYDTPIYLICRSGYRSYWAKEYLKNLSTPYTDVYTVDIDADEGNNIGGMLEWYAGSLPIHFGEVNPDRGGHGPQIYSGNPVDGVVVESAAPPTLFFTNGIFEPSWGRTGWVYADVVRTSLYIDGVEADFSTVDATGTGTTYTFSATLPYGPHTWNMRAETENGFSGVQVSWNPHAADAFPGPGDRTIIVTCDMPFSDVPSGHWAEYFINAIACSSISSGCGGGNYCPDDTVTRKQMSAFIIRAVEGEPAADYCGTTDPFPDVPYGDWACKYIKRLVELGITTGCEGGANYCPDDIVTRKQMSAFIIRAVEGEPAADYCGTTDPFTDVPYGDWACKYIKRLVELDITTGCQGGSDYCPDDNTTRAQIAAFLTRAFLAYIP